MAGFNSVTLMGNLCRDIELRQTAGGDAVGNTAIAVNGTREGDVMFLDMSIWGKLAETCAGILSKGSRVLISGQLKQNNWTANDGSKRSKHEVVARVVQFLDRKGEVGGGGDPTVEAPIDDDNLPF